MNSIRQPNWLNDWPRRSIWAGLLVFLLLAIICGYLTYQRYMIVKNDDREIAENVAESAKERLQQALQYSHSATQAMTLLIDPNGQIRQFDSIAPTILRANKYIDAIEMVPGGSISHVYPPENNQAVIGYNILKDTSRNMEAFKAIDKQELFFAGPFPLRQGGIGIVGRLPVYQNNHFWGFTAVVIRLRTLLDAAGIDSTGANGFYYQLSKINPVTGSEEFFLPFRDQGADRYEIAVPVPDGEWKLSVLPVNGYKSIQAIVPVFLLGLLLSVIGGIFAAYASRAPHRLQRLVQQRTSELHKSEHRNKAIVNALPDMVYVINKAGLVLDFSQPTAKLPTTNTPCAKPGQRLSEVFPTPILTGMESSLSRALDTGEIVSFSYDMDIGNEKKSYECRFVRQTTDDVLVLVRDVSAARRIEQALVQSREELRKLSNHIEDVREEERLHIAREIHDELGQHLTVLKMNFSFLEKSISEINKQYDAEFEKISAILNDMIHAVRKISHELRPGVLDELGLAAALEWYCNDFSKKTGIKAVFLSDTAERDLPDMIKTGVFRIFQESLTNVARHAAASRVDVSLNLQQEELILLIEDDGQGFELASIDHFKTLGIIGMRERARKMGGNYSLKSSPGRGTVIDLAVPLVNS